MTTWHIDSYEKLKPYGYIVHGCVDGGYTTELEASIHPCLHYRQVAFRARRTMIPAMMQFFIESPFGLQTCMTGNLKAQNSLLPAISGSTVARGILSSSEVALVRQWQALLLGPSLTCCNNACQSNCMWDTSRSMDGKSLPCTALCIPPVQVQSGNPQAPARTLGPSMARKPQLPGSGMLCCWSLLSACWGTRTGMLPLPEPLQQPAPVRRFCNQEPCRDTPFCDSG